MNLGWVDKFALTSSYPKALGTVQNKVPMATFLPFLVCRESEKKRVWTFVEGMRAFYHATQTRRFGRHRHSRLASLASAVTAGKLRKTYLSIYCLCFDLTLLAPLSGVGKRIVEWLKHWRWTGSIPMWRSNPTSPPPTPVVTWLHGWLRKVKQRGREEEPSLTKTWPWKKLMVFNAVPPSPNDQKVVGDTFTFRRKTRMFIGVFKKHLTL